MDKLRNIRYAFRRNLPVLVGVCLCLYFSYHIAFGHRSYGRLSQLTEMSQQKETYLADLKIERAAIEKKVRMMRVSSLSIDMLEEQIRFILGYNHSDELVVLDD